MRLPHLAFVALSLIFLCSPFLLCSSIMAKKNSFTWDLLIHPHTYQQSWSSSRKLYCEVRFDLSKAVRRHTELQAARWVSVGKTTTWHRTVCTQRSILNMPSLSGLQPLLCVSHFPSFPQFPTLLNCLHFLRSISPKLSFGQKQCCIALFENNKVICVQSKGEGHGIRDPKEYLTLKQPLNSILKLKTPETYTGHHYKYIFFYIIDQASFGKRMNIMSELVEHVHS